MKKKILSAALASVLVCSNTAFAAEINISKEKNRYTVSLEAENETVVTMIAARKDADVDDDSNIIAIREGIAENGSVSFAFMFDDSSETDFDREYTIYVTNNTTMEKVQKNFSYVSEEHYNTALNWIENNTDADALEAMLEPGSAYRLAFQSMGFNFDCFDALDTARKKEAARLYIKERSGDPTKDMNNCFGIVMLNAGLDTGKALLCANPSFEGGAYKAITDAAMKSWIEKTAAKGTPYKDINSFIKAYDTACILYKFSKARFSDFEGLFGQYAGALGITSDTYYNQYKNLSKDKKAHVGEALADEQAKTPVQTVYALLNYLKAAYNKVYSSSGSSGGGAGSGSSGGTVAKSGAQSGALPGTAIVGGGNQPSADSKPVFRDMGQAAWAEQAVTALARKGIIDGFGDGTFRPLEPVTREQFIKMIVLAVGLYNEYAVCNFTDTKPGDWHYSYIASVYESGITTGISKYEFGVGRNLTRQEMATFAARAAHQYKELIYIREENVFDDQSSIAEYALESINELYRAGIISGMGDNLFEPEAKANRAQAALIIYNLFVQ